MADQDHLDILKQGVKVWNQWRKEYPDILPDLTETNLVGRDLNQANLSKVRFYRVDLTSAKLMYANLSKADLVQSRLHGANFTQANLTEAELQDTVLSSVNLTQANLSGAYLALACFSYADLTGADLSKASIFGTIFSNTDLSQVKGLDSITNAGPSTIGIDTIIRSQGKIPESFLRNAGVPDSVIEAIPSLVGSLKPIDYYSCFISYSSKDQAFTERLHADLQSKGVRCWFAPEDMDVGDKIRPRIEESVRLYDKLLLVLSEHSIASNWVAYEVERALNKEPQGKPNVLYPIRVDDAVMKSKAGWADVIKSTRHIGDFISWKNHDDYQKAFDRLLRALKAK